MDMLSTESKPTVAVSGAPPIDAVALLDRCQNSAALARRLAARFVAEAPSQLGLIRDALLAQDGGAAAQHLHKLRGSLGVFGAMTAHELARQLEERAATSELGGVETLLAALDRELGRVRAALEHFDG
jgi:HPt (histidine-containing phosphotransfer) domain-containing protein